MATVLGTSEEGPYRIPPAKDGELGTKTRCLENTEVLTNSINEEKN